MSGDHDLEKGAGLGNLTVTGVSPLLCRKLMCLLIITNTFLLGWYHNSKSFSLFVLGILHVSLSPYGSLVTDFASSTNPKHLIHFFLCPLSRHITLECRFTNVQHAYTHISAPTSLSFFTFIPRVSTFLSGLCLTPP